MAIPEVWLQQVEGRCKGVHKVEPLDRIWMVKPGTADTPWHVGYVARYDGAACLFLKHFTLDGCKMLVEQVRKIRDELFDMATSDKFGRVPDPKLIQAYVKGELKKPAKTTIVMPDGTPADNETTEENEDE